MISFVYFDVGGVVIQDLSEESKWTEFKRELGVPTNKDSEFEVWFTEKEKLLCVGKERLGLNFENIKLTNNDFISKFLKNESIWPLIYSVHERCKVGLLSNAYPGMLGGIQNNGLLPDIKWDVVIDSSIVGLRKPDPDIFKLAQQQANVPAAGILFVENSPNHIQAAKSLGWTTFLYDSSHPERSSYELSTYFKRLTNN